MTEYERATRLAYLEKEIAEAKKAIRESGRRYRKGNMRAANAGWHLSRLHHAVRQYVRIKESAA